MITTTVTRRRATAMLTASAVAGFGLVSSRARGAQNMIKIGQIAQLTGPNAELGHLQVNGAKLALDAVNEQDGAPGRRVEIVIEDSQSTNPGTVLAFSRLASRGDIVGYFSGTASTQTHALAPDALKAGRPVMILATDPKLTHMGHPWLFRCRPNDLYSARVAAEFGTKDLGKRKWAIVHSTDAFGTAGMKALTEALNTSGGLKPVLVQGCSNQQADFTPVALAVKRSDADVLASYTTWDNDVAMFARQLREVGVGLPWIGSANAVSTSAMRLAGGALFGTYAVTDFVADANPEARAFADRYEQLYKVRADLNAAVGFDSVRILVRAISDAQSTEPEAVRRAILAIRGFKGAEGEYNFDANGDGLHGYNVVKNDAGKITFIRHVEFQD